MAALVVAAGAGPAHADVAGRSAIIGTDLGADSLLLAATFGDHDTLGYVGAGAYLLGGPVVHARYGHWVTAGESLGLRVAAPAVLGYVGCTAFGDRHGQNRRDGHPGDPDDACLLGGLAGLALGIVGAEVVDWTVLSRDDGGAAPAARVVTVGGRF